ncbi:hypothetical protein [Burkholderia pseudomallei]|uniref:hypothetical protein n=1 Tax=Burkholderia pseudomallei TaxID=28450 RepID=UPI000E685C22|nr:hypothetical protein [Burkholderia pseudomallei]RIV45533.1 hypothetical protein D2W70_27735 [Burkholderia pseudomallei]RIV61802.1 hypothetical protein D2W49_14255 [Burkholderia pseudomallei]
MEDTRHDIEVSGFQNYTFGPDGGFLKGNGALVGRNLSFRTRADEGPVAELTRHRIYRLDVTVTASPDPGGHLFIAFDENGAEGTLSIFVDAELFRLLVQYPASTVQLGFRLPNSDPVLENGSYSAKVHLSFVSATQLLSTAPDSRHQAFDTELSEFVVRPQWSQLGRIAKELLESMEAGVRRSYGGSTSRDACMAAISSIFGTLRQTVPRDNDDAAILAQPPSEFRKAVDAMERNEASRLSDLYDNVWLHKDAGFQIRSGKMQPQDTVELSTDELEQVARDYLSTPHLSSPSLEWLLIDALLFNETVAFARSISWLPPTQPGPLFRYSLLRGGAKWVKEAVALVLTFALAEIVDSSHGIGFWIVAATITVARWARPDAVVTERTKIAQLLSDMASAQALLSLPDFNARLLRERLYELAKRGAAFKQVAYSLLDKRISREETSR